MFNYNDTENHSKTISQQIYLQNNKNTNEEVNLTYTTETEGYKIGHDQESSREKYSTLNKVNLINDFNDISRPPQTERTKNGYFRHLSNQNLRPESEKISLGVNYEIQPPMFQYETYDHRSHKQIKSYDKVLWDSLCLILDYHRSRINAR